MAIRRSDVKACCGGSGSIQLYCDKKITKGIAEFFQTQNGWTVPTHYMNNGIFYVRKDTLTGTASFGMTKIHVKVGNYRKEEQVAEFINLLEQALAI